MAKTDQIGIPVARFRVSGDFSDGFLTCFSEVAPDFGSHHTIPVVMRAGLTGLAIGEGGQKANRTKL